MLNKCNLCFNIDQDVTLNLFLFVWIFGAIPGSALRNCSWRCSGDHMVCLISSTALPIAGKCANCCNCCTIGLAPRSYCFGLGATYRNQGVSLTVHSGIISDGARDTIWCTRDLIHVDCFQDKCSTQCTISSPWVYFSYFILWGYPVMHRTFYSVLRDLSR